MAETNTTLSSNCSPIKNKLKNKRCGLLGTLSKILKVSKHLVKKNHRSLRYNSFVVVQLPGHVQLFGTPWTSAHQAFLSFSITWSLFKLMSIELVMPSKVNQYTSIKKKKGVSSCELFVLPTCPDWKTYEHTL